MPTAAIMTFIAGSLLTLYFGILELMKEKRSYLKVAILTIIFCVFLGAGLYDILEKTDSSRNDKDEILESSKEGTKALNKKLDSTGKGLSDKIDSMPLPTAAKYQKESAIIDLCHSFSNPKNPYLAETLLKDSFIIHISICNEGKGIAYNIKDITAIVSLSDNNLSYFPYTPPSAFNKDIVMSPTAGYTMEGPIIRRKDSLPTDRHFFCVKIAYSDSTKTNKNWIGMYETTNFQLNIPLSIPNSIDFYRIKNFLEKKKVW
jgi:hypothetical protein